MFFSVITKNLNWEILNKNSVTFKNGIGLRMKNVNDMGVGSNKNPMFRGGAVTKKTMFRGELPKKRGFDIWQI